MTSGRSRSYHSTTPLSTRSKRASNPQPLVESLSERELGVLRLVAAPLFALALNLAFRLQGPAFQAGILESAMPTAVILTVLATEYDVDPSFVSTAVFTTTLLSPITITPLLAYLGA